jgi:hypothetical protein
MKILTIIFAVFMMKLEIPKQDLPQKNHTEVFVQKSTDKLINKIELSYNQGSIVGKFYGCEKLTDGSPIYYMATLSNLTINDNSIRFKIEKYSFSKIPFDKSNVAGRRYSFASNKLPGLLKFPQNYTGDRYSDTLRLKRTSLIFDSSYEQLIFVKINDADQ